LKSEISASDSQFVIATDELLPTQNKQNDGVAGNQLKVDVSFKQPVKSDTVDQGQSPAPKQRSESGWVHCELSDDLNVTDDGLNDAEMMNFVEQLQSAVEREQPSRPHLSQGSRQIRDITNTSSTSEKTAFVAIAINEHRSPRGQQQQQSKTVAAATVVAVVNNTCRPLKRAVPAAVSVPSNNKVGTNAFKRPEPARSNLGVCLRLGSSPSGYAKLRAPACLVTTPVIVNVSHDVCERVKSPAAAVTSGGLHVLQTPGHSTLSTSFRTPVVHVTPSSSAMKSTPPLCDCGCRSKRKVVQSPGPNVGRFFFCCGTGNSASKAGCKFFKWETGNTQQGKSVALMNSMNNSRNNSLDVTSPMFAAPNNTASHVTPVSIYPRCFSRSRVVVPQNRINKPSSK
jgi:hypothetical protein